MRLTQQLKTEILDVYEACWGSLLYVDLEIYSLVLDDNYRMIGTTENEVFFNKWEAINSLKSTGDQLAGNIERRNKKIKIEAIDSLIFITEQFDAYVLLENDWAFYGKTRVSTWMQQKRHGWKIIQQHFSFPDIKAEEGQTIGLEKLSKENLELRDAVNRRTIELEQKNQQLKITLENLKSTKNQLIQSEKMASLGELTAGIAHEIQNPLNFVNNFSEVNIELSEELKSELERLQVSDTKKVFLSALVDDLAKNQEKILHHGKRADAIVKGMLQHSRSNTGEKELTDINALADEFLRLSYHGFRAKEKTFTAEIKTHFDKAIGKVDVVAQDVGRVLLNLFNNSFYSMNEKKQKLNGVYEPTVELRTEQLDGKIQVTVKDNGMGIPQKVLGKIFQPFFTTKPAGEGTGLGLSLSYDIIKAHGGELKIETKEGEGAVFILQLPIGKN
jgi:signal transduction histidine kinase